VATNLRIVLGAGQVLSLLSGVLKLVFPTEARAALGVVTIFVAGAPLSATGAGRFQLCVAHLTHLHADVGSLVSLECQGWGWYGKWTLVVAGVPSLALLAIGVRWLQLRFGGCLAKPSGLASELPTGRFVRLISDSPCCRLVAFLDRVRVHGMLVQRSLLGRSHAMLWPAPVRGDAALPAGTTFSVCIV
jgi:hypothetical protein